MMSDERSKAIMQQITPSQLTPRHRSLFASGAPASLRCIAVLEGQMVGQIWVEAIERPSWGIVREAAFGTLYFGGAPPARQISDLINELRHQGEVLVGLWPEDDLWQSLPSKPEYTGSVLEFTDRQTEESTRYKPGSKRISVPAQEVVRVLGFVLQLR
jgi:hypothetical protein